MLATTFTRAAAAEIRDRVFTDLATLVLDDDERASQNAHGRFVIGAVDRDQAAAALERLVAGLPDLQIRTLDSVFAGLAGGLGPASGLPVDGRLIDESAARDLLHDAIGIVLDGADEHEVLDTLETLGKGATKVSVVPTVERAIIGLLSEAEESTPQAWHWAHPPRDEAFMQRLESIGKSLEQVLPTLSKTIARPVASLLPSISEAMSRDGAIWIDLLDKKIVAESGPDGSQLYSRKPIDDAALPALQAFHEIVLGGNLRNLARRTACLRHLVDAILPSYREVKRRSRAVEFDDYVRALDPGRGGVSREVLDELWFRLDTRLEHLLLDEFQDTSATQLRAIRPLAQEILSGGDGERPRSLLVVGDVKQSIYGWRGGDPAILERFGASLETSEDAIPEERLVRSYRSSPAVIELVNTIFAGIGGSPAVCEKSPAAAAHFEAMWSEHATAKDHPGEAIVEFLPPCEDDEDDTAVIARAAAESAERLTRRHPGGTVAVIVRSNKVIGPIVEALRALGVDARGQGGGSLLDAEAAVAVVQAFRLAADPEDRVAAEDLARSPLGALLELEHDAGQPNRRVPCEVRRVAATRLRRSFDIEGPAAVVDGWRRRLAGRVTRREASRLRQMVEVLGVFDTELGAPRSPRAIERHLRTCRVPDAGGGGVVVMTVHQSKGLEFDGVVVTEMKASLFRDPTIATATPAVPAGGIDRVATWYSEKARPAEAAAIHQQATDRIVLESLCSLYVALTRAARDLVVQVPRPEFIQSGEPAAASLPTWGGVVRAAIGRDGPGDAPGPNDSPDDPDGDDAQDRDDEPPVSPIGSGLPDAVVLRRIVHGDPKTPEARSTDSKVVSTATDVLPTPTTAATSSSVTGEPDGATAESIRIRATGRRRRRAVTMPPPSSSHRRGDLLRVSNHEALERGSAVHALFERIERAADVDVLDDATLMDVARGAAPGRGEDWWRDRVASVRSALASPAVRAVYDGASGPTVVRVEYPFLRRTDRGVQTGFIDRLVLHLDVAPSEGAPPPTVVGASVLDFKTDRPDAGSPTDLPDFLDRHRDQMASYRSVVAERYGLEPTRIGVSLIRVDDGAIVHVPAS